MVPGAKKVVLFLTDGVPTFPIGAGSEQDPGDVEAALREITLAPGLDGSFLWPAALS